MNPTVTTTPTTPLNTAPRNTARYGWLVAALIIIAVCAVFVMQSQINGSEHYFMIDSGETQIVLNVWGTLHATGYPHYILLTAPGVALLRGLFGPATAPAMMSLFWGLCALGLAWALLVWLGVRHWVAAAAILIYALTRTVYVHLAIAEIYSFTLLILVGLYWLALRNSFPLPSPQRNSFVETISLPSPPPAGEGADRPLTPDTQHPDATKLLPPLFPDPQPLTPNPQSLYLLSLLGGIGVAHHRALVVVIPALLYAMWPTLWPLVRRKPYVLLVCLALALLGFLPYIYLPLRAQAGAAWVYGEPGTWDGFLDQFLGREANRFIGLPATLDALIANIRLVTDVISTDVSLVGIVLGILGLIVGITRPATRRAAITFALGGGAAFLFHTLFYTDVLSALILITTFSLMAGWAFAAENVLYTLVKKRVYHFVAVGFFASVTAVCTTMLLRVNVPFIYDLIVARPPYSDSAFSNPAQEAIRLAGSAPPGSTLMIPWGMRHFAVGFARDVEGRLPNITLVDHKADLRAAAQNSRLVVPGYLIYDYPPAWWEAQLGQPIYPRAAAYNLVEIALAPEMADDETVRSLPRWGRVGEGESDAPGTAAPVDVQLQCAGSYLLTVDWLARTQPDRDNSVFVYMIERSGNIALQNDQYAPVYGWRPLTTWQPGEIVRDVYQMPNRGSSYDREIRFGLYEQTSDGTFRNTFEMTVPLSECE